MKDQFVPYKHAQMMEELGFILSLDKTFAAYGKPENGGGLYTGAFDTTALRAPLYSQAEEWLWEQRQLRIVVRRIPNAYTFDIFKEEIGERKIAMDKFTCYHPIRAHQEGILKAIEYIYSQKNNLHENGISKAEC